MKNKYPRLTQSQLTRLKNIDFSNLPGFHNSEEYLTEKYGEPDSPTRIAFEEKAGMWYYAEILKERRKALGLTQKDLAERVGRERTYINRIEKGETDMQLSSFLRIASALGITLQLTV